MPNKWIGFDIPSCWCFKKDPILKIRMKNGKLLYFKYLDCDKNKVYYFKELKNAKISNSTIDKMVKEAK